MLGGWVRRLNKPNSHAPNGGFVVGEDVVHSKSPLISSML
jgi:hypothetical protein